MVKFIQRYPIATHQILVEKKLAPRILSVHDQGRWKAIFMEDLTASGYVSFEGPVPQAQKSGLIAAVKKAVDDMHGLDIVHGDIRAPNLMWRELDGKMDVKFIDLDWAGKVGEAKYPPGLNQKVYLEVTHSFHEQMRYQVFPDSAKCGAKIEKEHDLHMVNLLVEAIEVRA